MNSLIALRSEREDVFAATHALVIGWARDGIVDGLRIDHIDGLRDPAAYLDRLRAAVGPDVLIARREDPDRTGGVAGVAGAGDDRI